jgi:hypothetical protein
MARRNADALSLNTKSTSGRPTSEKLINALRLTFSANMRMKSTLPPLLDERPNGDLTITAEDRQ